MSHRPRRTDRRQRPRRSRLGMLLSGAVGAALLSWAVPAAPATAADSPATHAPDPGVTANLWEWNWPSVARACRDHLAKDGYDGVQVAPPQDSLKRTELGNGSDTVLHPWWEVYQAVDYALTSRMGDEAQFRSMVSTCRRSGVKVYVDAVINHTTGQGDTSYGGRHYERYDYPGLYAPRNFHKYSGDCPSASGGIEDFNNVAQVRNCELVGLADLRTDTRVVRDRLAGYLNKLIGYGVSGFRVDAAKHIAPADLDAIYSRLHRTKDGTRPYWALEVFGGGPGVLSPQAFTSHGDVLGLDGRLQLQAAFKSYPSQHVGSIAALKDFGAGSGLTAGRRTLSFVENHDTERDPGTGLSYKDGATNTLATQYLLASGYGSPQVYSSFTFSANDASPPATTDGQVSDTVCGADWTCLERDRGVVALVKWHQRVGDSGRRHWWDDGGNVIAFNRGPGWVALNNNTDERRIDVQTGLPRGRYCDRVTGRPTRSGGCTGTTVRVRSDGRATVYVPGKGAVAIWRPRG